jgi:mRNA interferase RelE/StbE
MTFKVFVHPTLFVKVPAERKEHIKSAIKELTNPFPDSNGNKKITQRNLNSYISS